MNGSARVFAVYQGGRDVPAGRRFAVREWILLPGGRVIAGVLWFSCSLDGARAHIPAGAGYRMSRDDDEPDELVESWL